MNEDKPKRWYFVMCFCLVLSFGVFLFAPRLGYPTWAAHDIGILIGLWAPIMGIMGIRAETKLAAKQQQAQQ